MVLWCGFWSHCFCDCFVTLSCDVVSVTLFYDAVFMTLFCTVALVTLFCDIILLRCFCDVALWHCFVMLFLLNWFVTLFLWHLFCDVFSDVFGDIVVFCDVLWTLCRDHCFVAWPCDIVLQPIFPRYLAVCVRSMSNSVTLLRKYLFPTM